MKMFDTHAHLQDSRFDACRHEVIRRSISAGIRHILCCGVQESDWPDVSGLSQTYPNLILPAYGLHPWFIKSRSDDWLEQLERRISSSRAALGEIGLDRMVSPRNDTEQIRVLTAQLDLARRYRRPVSIHCRKAFGLLAHLLEKGGGLPQGGILHSFSGSAEMAKRFQDLGAHISFSGALTRPGNKKSRRAVHAVTPDRLLVESDAPDLLPSGAPEGLNEPAHIQLTLEVMAQIRGQHPADLAALTHANALWLLSQDGEHDTLAPDVYL